MSNSQKLSQVVAGGNDVVLDILAATANPNEYLKVGSSGTALTFEPSSALVLSLGIANGATETTTSASLTLTNASTQVQYVTTTLNYKSVVLPDATTLTPGADKYVIENLGSFTIVIRSASQAVIGQVEAGYGVSCDLVNNSTAAGTWYFRKAAVSTFSAIFANPVVTSPGWSTSVHPQSKVSCFPNTNYAVCVTGTSIFLATVAAGTATFGTPNTLGTTAAYVAVQAIDATTAVVVYRDSGDSNKWKAVHATINGTGFTLGTPITLSTTDHYGTCVSQISASAVLVTARNQSNNRPEAVAITISGTTLTAGSVLELSTTTVNVGLVANAVMAGGAFATCIWSDSSTSNRPRGVRISISGTTLTVVSTAALLHASEANNICCVNVNTARSVMAFIDGVSDGYLTVLDVTGTADFASAGAPVLFESAADAQRSLDMNLCQFGATAMFITYANNKYETLGRVVTLTAATSTSANVNATPLSLYGGTGLTALMEYAGSDYLNSSTVIINGQDYTPNTGGMFIVEGVVTR